MIEIVFAYLNFKRFDDRTHIQNEPQRLFEIKAFGSKRGKSRELYLLVKSKGSNRDIHGPKEDN